MRDRKTGLASFNDRQKSERQGQGTSDDIRTKAKGETVAVTLRLTPDQWERVHQLARSERISLNRLALLALSKLFQEKGLPGL